ncbi:S-adenosylhomocysteine hydrolase [Mitsuaria sp. WAJ17]|uniref:S-adenosylhomocysteine hydrolase n=1 Tax=Mitsuaria sp. WAJ17 TaxID=2761452 RepID=UPI0016004772|nr:S-adenosylhomocysteine hydrolase [Mitsuaria sp. WAJ17]MBB2486827.1 S-adenosylhomocysteine hydrolase [Mitsuaria sp. WAJ17]
MRLKTRIKRHLERTQSPVLLRRELKGLGSETQLSAALKSLLAEGVIVRIGVGVYAIAKVSVLSGKPIPTHPLEVLAPLALRKLGVRVEEPYRSRDYNAGRTTQVPTGLVINTGGRRVTRKIGFNGKFVEYERS